MSQIADIPELVAAAAAGERRALARVLSLVESGGTGAAEVQRALRNAPADGYVIGVTGAPGAGKSTLVGALLRELRHRGRKVAVLAVDPSSPFSRGALLGDRLRMSGGRRDDGVFIRSMASRGQQGGLAAATQAASLALQCCGWPWVLIETVGVGQVEVDIAAMADSTVLVLNPGWGDAVQANKAGLMEIGDIFVINKADRPGCADTRKDLLSLLAQREGESPPVLETVATEGRGIPALAEAIAARHEKLAASGGLEVRQAGRIARMVRLGMRAEVERRLQTICDSTSFEDEVARVAAGQSAVPDAVERLLSAMDTERHG